MGNSIGGARKIPLNAERIWYGSPPKLPQATRPKPPKELTAPVYSTRAEIRLQIQNVDPRQLIIEKIIRAEAGARVQTPGEKQRKGLLNKLGAGSLAALAATLIPKLAYAGPLAALTSGPVGIAALIGVGAVGLAFYVKYMFGFDKTMGERNSNPGDPTLRKQLAVFSMIPLSILTGTGLVYLGACFLPWGTAPTFFALAGAGLIYGLTKTGIAIYQSIRANRQTISPGYKSTLRGIFGTNILSHGVQGAEAAYIFYRGATLFELLAGVGAYVGHAVATTSLGTLATGAGIIGIPLFLLVSNYLRFTSRKWNGLQHQHGPRFDLTSRRGIRNLILAAAGSAAAGALLYSFAPVIINLALALAFFTTEVHALVHNWSCQGGSRDIIKKPPEEYSDTAAWHAARRPNSPWITVMKPGFDPKDFLFPTYAMLYLRKGVNSDFNIISGINMGMVGNFIETHYALEFMRGKQQAILDIINAYRHRINSAATLPDRYAELANFYEALANHWDAESVGDFRAMRSVPDGKGNPSTPYAGQTGVFVRPDAEEFELYLSKVIRWEGGKIRALAGELRARAMMAQEEVNEHLKALERQYSLIYHWFPPKQFRNLCPDIIKSKIREIDLFNQLTKRFKTGASILKRNRLTGEYYWEIIPCRRLRGLDTHTKTLAWTSRSDGEMARIESFSDVRYLDNTKMADPAGPAHSRQAYTYAPMRAGESVTVVCKNGRRVTFHANGTVTDNGIAHDPNSDEVVWVPGMPNPPAGLPKGYFDSNGNLHDVFRPSLFHFFCSRYQTMCDGEHADINTSDFLAALEKDIKAPYVLSLWKVPEEINLPWDEELKANPHDRLVRISASYANFMLRVRESATGKTLFIPYNWVKNTQIKGGVWTNIHRIELMSRNDFKTRFGVDARDSHGDKFPNVIVAYDRRGQKLGKTEEVLPFSHNLRDPSHYSAAEFDRGLGRIGDMNFVAYTFERADGSRYMRWLPRENDWPELDFEERNERFVFKGKRVLLQTCRWIGKRFYFDRHRLALDAGDHENPNFEVTAIQGPEVFLKSIDAAGRFVFARYARNTTRVHGYQTFNGIIKNLDNVIDQRLNGNNLELTRITPEDKVVVPIDNIALNHPAAWISAVSFNPDPNSNVANSVSIAFVNPFNGQAAGTQTVSLPRPVDLTKIYLQGNNQAFLPKIFDQRQRNDQTRQIATRLFLTYHNCRLETIQHGLTLNPEEEIKLIEVKSSLQVRHSTTANGRAIGASEWVPFDQAMPGAARSPIWFDPQHTPFSSGLVFGRVDTMLGPQHLVPVHRGVGTEFATDDQKLYFGDAEGEYNYYAGWITQQDMPALGSHGPFSLQYAKSVRGAALNTGSNTVMRAPHEDLLFAREELEVGAENDMPVSLEKSLFDKATTTEDAQGAWEKKRMFDLDTRMDRTVRSAGASVNNVGEGMGQRGRWAAMLQFLQRVPKIFYDEIVRARLLKQIPPQYSNAQLHEWFNTFTWYLDTVFKHVVPVIPLAYMAGLSPLPAGAIVFPLLWAIKTGFGWPKYSYDNQRVGVSRWRSYFRNLGLYYLYIPNISRNAIHINDEAKGPFISTAGSGGRTFYPWAVRRIVYFFGLPSAITTAIGIYRVFSFGMFSMSYFGLVMNVIWPAMMLAGVGYALKMVWQETRERNNVSGLSHAISQGIRLRNRNWTPLKNWTSLINNEFISPLTISWFKEFRAALKEASSYYRS